MGEIDAVLTWVPVELAAGYSRLLLGDGARAILGANLAGGRTAAPTLAHFAYLQATLRIS